MLDIYQKTLSKKVTFKGIGLHSGKYTTVKVNPAKEDEGIVFKRIDLKNNNLIKANFANVSSAKLCTTLENNYGVKVSTVEHLLAAMYMSGVDNAVIELSSEEVPIMDGSAKEFLETFNKVKTKTLLKKRKYLKVNDKVTLIEGKKNISIESNQSSLEVEFQLDYKNEIIGNQKNFVNFHTDNLNDVYNSRTFCLYEDVEKIKKAGLAKGGSLGNAIVVNEDKVLNEGGLRNNKEFVNHKILDLAGDFILSGYRILGKVSCYHGGHELTNKFLRKLFGCSNAFEIIELDNILISKELNSNTNQKIAINA